MKPPIAVTLGLDPRRLPAETFERLAEHGGYVMRDRASREERSRKAWESFGAPGRDPSAFGSVLGALADRGRWTPHLKTAQLRNHWDEIVGPAIAANTVVADFRDGVLAIRAASPVWADQLRWLLPELSATIRERLDGLDIREIRVTGPGTGYDRYRRGRRNGF
ncbi:DciA family protein [Bifidobacterium samirii]|uniref:Zn-ribbon-containing RNA-binding protein n=1 Tax=Bifidobacterium samirii TaxID=2306974 RepID=A0A430FV79_9BIFI|nr:DUF721 domain-containing protein [Bifidobacterium samirii]RSX57465.1 hypothetical protein D2E24_0763 [Bifidobacterium samirii]